MQRIALHSVPRSGSTWLGSILDAHPNIIYKYQPLFSYAFKNRLSNKSQVNEIIDFFEEIAQSDDDFINQREAKGKGIVPVFEKEEPTFIAYKEVRYHHILENLLQQDKELKVIGLIRNPLAVINSWWKAPKEFRADLGWEFELEWLHAPSKNQNKNEEFNGYNKWKEVAFLFHQLKKRYPDRFFLMNYKYLINDPLNQIRKLMEFVGLKLDEQQIKFLDRSTTRSVDDAYGVFKIKSEDTAWKQNLPENIVDYIFADLKRTNLEIYLK